MFFKSFAQPNLVPNPSFEDTVSCPFLNGQINFAKHWINPTKGTPDYFNACNNNMVGVPLNYAGNTIAHTGNAYALILNFAHSPSYSDSVREYVQVKLDSTLIKDEIYCISFYVNVPSGKETEYAVNNIGTYFSPTQISSNNFNPLHYIPQFENPKANPLTTINVWTKVSGQFTSSGGENYLTIGNFNSNAKSDTVYIKPCTYCNYIAPLYIDDVSVIHLNAGAGNDTSICIGDSLLIGRPAISGYTYNWQPAIGLNNPTIAQPKASPLSSTTYTLTVTNINGCTKIDSISIIIVDANAGNDTTICLGDSLTIGTNSLNGVNYSWSPNLFLNNNTISQPISSPQSIINYTVTASASGCALSDTVIINVLPNQSPAVSIETYKDMCWGDSIQIGAIATLGYNYLWGPNFNIENNTSSLTYAYPATTTTYILTVSDTLSNYLCKSNFTDSVKIDVINCDSLIVPNIFTPNNDGVNDFLIIENLFKGTMISIYNRWGEEILYFNAQSTSRSNFVWDGYNQIGKECLGGVYYYIITIPDNKSFKGFIQLIR